VGGLITDLHLVEMKMAWSFTFTLISPKIYTSGEAYLREYEYASCAVIFLVSVSETRFT
jgi:hypothetical protein